MHLTKQCESVELKLQLAEENEQSLNINLKDLQNQFDQVKQEHTKSKDELSTCQTQISGLQCLLEQKEQEKEVSIHAAIKTFFTQIGCKKKIYRIFRRKETRGKI